MNILNLGSGNRILVGDEGDTVINHDIVAHREEINCVADLNVTPWIWRDNEFDRVEMISVAEHLKLTLIETLDELWRILKPSGELIIRYPIYTSDTIHDDPQHRWLWSARSIEYVCPDLPYGQTYAFYTVRKWRILDSGVIKNRNFKSRMTPIK